MHGALCKNLSSDPLRYFNYLWDYFYSHLLKCSSEVYLSFWSLSLYSRFYLKFHLRIEKEVMNKRWHVCLESSFVSALKFGALAQTGVKWEEEIAAPGPAHTSCVCSWALTDWNKFPEYHGCLIKLIQVCCRETTGRTDWRAERERWLTPSSLPHAVMSKMPLSASLF